MGVESNSLEFEISEESSSSKYLDKFASSFDKSMLQATITFAASGSSIKANKRCSKVASSCLRAAAKARDLCIAFSNVVENEGTF